MRFNVQPDRDIPLYSYDRISDGKFSEFVYCIESWRDTGPKIVAFLAFSKLQ